MYITRVFSIIIAIQNEDITSKKSIVKFDITSVDF